MIGSKYIPRQHGVPLLAATQPSGCGCGGASPSGCACGGHGATAASGCVGCGSIPGAAPSGRIDPAMCACKHKGKSHGPGVFGGTPMTTPDRPSTTFVPPPPPMRSNVVRPRLPMPPAPPPRGVPVDTQGGAFVPPPPPVKRDDKQPRLPPPVMLMPKDGGGAQGPGPSQVTLTRKDPTQAPGPTITVTALPGISLAPNPFSPFCGDGRIDPNSEFCREARGQGVSDACQRELLDFLAMPEPKMSLERWIATRELCDQDALRRAANVAITVAAKTSAGLYGRSGALPNYHGSRGVYGFAPSGDASNGLTAAEDAELDRLTGGRQALASDWTHGGAANLGFGGEGGDTYVAPAPATPPVDYAALAAGIGTGLAASIGAIGTVVNNANNGRLRELEIEYANTGRAAQLALQRTIAETNAEIQRLAAQNSPNANATVQALQQTIMGMQQRLEALPPAPAPGAWTTTEIGLAIALGLTAVGAVGYFVTRR